MAGCARGYLHLHTYVRYIEFFSESLYADGNSNECANSTECSVPWTPRIYLNRLGAYKSYAHGWNTTTGGSDYATVSIIH
jgi:hypothetical protein